MSTENCPHKNSEPVDGGKPHLSDIPDTSRAAKIPHPKYRVPFLGDVFSLDAKKPTQKELKMAAELGPIFERKIMGHRLTIVTGAGLVEELNDETRFAKFLALPYHRLRRISGDGLFTAHNSEPNWAKAHNVLMPGFSQQAMRRYHETMKTVVQELVDHWITKADQTFDIAPDLNKLTLEIVARAGFGHTFDSWNRDDPFVEAITRTLSHTNARSNQLPIMGLLFGRRADKQHTKDIAYIQGVVDKVIAARQVDPDRRHDDLLDLMLHVPDSKTGELLDHVNVRNQVLTFLVAGSETTAGTLALSMFFLASHPEVLSRVRAEVDSNSRGQESFTFEQVGKLRYTRSVVDETLRMWPSAPGYFRKARHDTALADGLYPMKAGDWMFILTLGLHRDPVWGDDPHAFDPDRFSSMRAKSRPAHAYRPFGTGPRSCIGRQFALHEAVLALAEIVRTQEFQLEPGCLLDIGEALVFKPTDLRMKVTQRARYSV